MAWVPWPQLLLKIKYIYKFVCHYWQWPILIKCMKCYYSCFLRWLLRPILALNCLLQIEQERSEEESSFGDALALSFHCTHFCSASLILFASYSPAPLLMRPRHFVRSCAICSHDSVRMLKSLRVYGWFWGCPCVTSSDHHGSVFLFVVLHRGFSWSLEVSFVFFFPVRPLSWIPADCD